MDSTNFTQFDFQSLWQKYASHLEGKKKLVLLKEIEKLTAEIFKTDPTFQSDRDVLVNR
jgi:hypothetical protein